MSNAGPQLPHWTAAFIPPEGIVLEAINPAIRQKKTRHRAGQDARDFGTAARTLPVK